MPRAGRLSKAAPSVRACWADPGADRAARVALSKYCIIGRRQIQDRFPGEHPKSTAVLVLCNSDLFKLWWIGYDNDMRLCRCVAFRKWHFLKRESATRPCHARSES